MNYIYCEMLQKNFNAKCLPNTWIRRRCARCAWGGWVWNWKLFQLSLPPTPSAIGKMMPPPLIASVLFIDHLKREKAITAPVGTCRAHCCVLSWHCCNDCVARGCNWRLCKVQCLGSFRKIKMWASALLGVWKIVGLVFWCDKGKSSLAYLPMSMMV